MMRMLPIIIIAVQILASLTMGLDLKCTSSQVYVDGLHVQTCIVQGLVIYSKNEEITSVNGATEPTDFESVVIEKNIVNYMPQGLAKFFPQLKRLRIYNSQLREVHQKDFAPLTNLTYLNLDDNVLEMLDGDLFEFNPELQEIYFNYNQLGYIGTDFLIYLKKLRKGQFQSNTCTSDRFPKYYGGDSAARLFTSIKSNCPSPEDIRKKKFSNDIEKLNKEITKLKAELERGAQQHKEVYKKCDGNLDSATKNLLLVSNQLKTCKLVETRSFSDDEELVDLIVLDTKEEEHNATDLIAINLKIEKVGTKVKAVKGKDGKIFVSEYETGLEISYQETLFLPTNLGEIFPQLEQLSVTHSGLYEIGFEIFEGMNSLKLLNLTGNKLQEITSDTFNDLKNLTSLDLSHNNLVDLEPKAFDNLVNLETLNFDNNLLININGELFVHLQKLKKLLLNDNKLKFISVNLLTPLTSLQVVDFSKNDCIDMKHPEKTLNEIDDEIIDHCIAPIELTCQDAVDNQITVQKNGNEKTCEVQNLTIFFPKTKISKIVNDFKTEDSVIFSVVGQQMKLLPFQLNKSFPKLQKIIVERSQLTTLNKIDFEGLKALKNITITFNNISTIGQGAFDEVPQIDYLNLASNNIKTLPNIIFVKLTHMKILILADNQLTRIHANLLPRRNLIENFQVQNNELDTIETKILRALRRATLIDLSGNVCIDLKYEKSENSSRALIELSGEIDLNCSEEEVW